MKVKIRIENINLKKDIYDKKYVLPQFRKDRPALIKLDGNIEICVFDDKIVNARQKMNINKISSELQDELYDVLCKIEDELNSRVSSIG